MDDKNFDHSKLNENSKEWMINQFCIHPEHNPPNMLCLRAGEVYKHTCPACGKETLMCGNDWHM